MLYAIKYGKDNVLELVIGEVEKSNSTVLKDVLNQLKQILPKFRVRNRIGFDHIKGALT